MPERHVTDEEIREASGHAPRPPAGVPRATCLGCGAEHVTWYATMAHECMFSLTDETGKPRRAFYYEFLIELQRLGLGVVQHPTDLKFPIDKVITARTALTQHLQTNLHVNGAVTINFEYYEQPEWLDTGMPFLTRP